MIIVSQILAASTAGNSMRLPAWRESSSILLVGHQVGRNMPPVLELFHSAVRQWFQQTFPAPTPVQKQAWPALAAGKSALLLAPTGSGKTLAAFLVAIDRVMFSVKADAEPGVRVLYISPLKALGADVERNLRAPIAGVRALADLAGTAHRVPDVGVRSGDTAARERYQMSRRAPDVLITTPESLYLILTSRARQMLVGVETVIVDEIHSLVGTKRGAHLAVTLERLEQLRRQGGLINPLQRVGLSATQRPLDEVARLLGGAEIDSHDAPARFRPVEIVEAGRRKQLELRIEVPVEDMARLGEPVPQSGPAAAGPTPPSIWPSIHPRLVELIQTHRSTMIFVNSRRLAERLAGAINETSGKELAAAHHGSIARDTRLQIEDRLKRGQLPAIVATSSLELGIDMGAVDLVIQIEAPPSIAAGIQRVGRAGHHVGAPSSGIIFPKYRGDLLACSAAVPRMQQGEVECTFYPRNPLDVLAQQLVAMASQESVAVEEAYRIIRGAAPFAELPRAIFESVLDLLSGRYPSDEFSELRPRVTWDRLAGEITPRRGTQRLAIVNAGTIPDRGLYGVFLADGTQTSRVGELDEEMVFETRAGDVFLLGASSWRVIDITQDRVLVVPAPGEPGKMPFWRGDGPGRPLEFGRSIGAHARQLGEMEEEAAFQMLTSEHGLDPRAARNLLTYLADQRAATGEIPSDRTIVIEAFLDEVGDWRIAVMSPYGSRVHAPWAMAVAARLRAEVPGEVDMMWSDDGMVFRLPESDQPPDVEMFLPAEDEVENTVVRELGSTALFAARFRENAARALLLPRRQPGRRTPLWLQRRRAADLLAVAARYERFPLMLETYRECLRDIFDLPGLKGLLGEIRQRRIRVRRIQSDSPSPFAASLLFSYTANFLYSGDAPLAERRAQTLALDHAQLRELLGDAELRELLDAEVVEEVAAALQRQDGTRFIKDADMLHEWLLALGDMSRSELAARCAPDIGDGKLDEWLDQLLAARRIFAMQRGGEARFAAAEDAARFRDALGVVPPPGLPDAFLEPVADPLGDLVSRYARTHVAFHAEQVAQALGISVPPIRAALKRLVAAGRVLEGQFLPGGRGAEWCDAGVLRTLKRRSLARLRKQVEPVDAAVWGEFLVRWQGIDRPRRGLDGLLDAVELLQGAPLPASDLEQRILPARVSGFEAKDLDELCAAGEIVWQGSDSLGPGDGRIALYLTDNAPRLARLGTHVDDPLERQIVEVLDRRGAIFFDALLAELGGFRNDLRDALWRLVWSGHVTNDTLAPLRSLAREHMPRKTPRRKRTAFRSRRNTVLPGTEGRWTLFGRGWPEVTTTERQTALATQLLERYGILTRELVAAEGIAGGFSGMYPVLKAMEEAGRIRRGYFVAGQGAAQFAAPGAEDRLREPLREAETDATPLRVLAATDPANPYGAALRWPISSISDARPQRAAGAQVILWRGQLLGYLSRTSRSLLTFLPDLQPERDAAEERLVEALSGMALPGAPLFLAQIDGQDAGLSPLAPRLQAAGFVPLSRGYRLKAS